MMQTDDRRTKPWVLALTAGGSFMAVLDAMVVAATLGTIRADLGASIEALQWTLNAYNLSFAVLLLAGAALGDRFGRRRLFVAGIGLFTAASAVCALAGNAEWLIAARAVQGAAAALIMPLAMALLSAAFPPAERAKALGIFSGINGLALIVGPIVGGAIAEGASWQWIFWINIPIGLVLMPLARRRLPESFGTATPIDLLGILLVTGSALGVVWGLLRGNDAGWTSAEVTASLAAGVALALLFVAWQLRTSAPMVPMRLFRARAFSSSIGATFLYCAAMYGVLFLLPQFLQQAQGNSPLSTGLRMLPWCAMLFLVAPVSGALVNRIGERRLIVVGLALQALALGWLGAILVPGLAYAKLAAPLILAGAGVSMAMPATQSAVLNAVARPEVGTASGILNMFRYLGGTTGIAIAVAAFSAAGGLGSPRAFSAGFAAALGLSAVLSLLGAVAGLWQPARRQPLLLRAESGAAD